MYAFSRQLWQPSLMEITIQRQPAVRWRFPEIAQDLANILIVRPYHKEDITVSSFGPHAVSTEMSSGCCHNHDCACSTSHHYTHSDYSELQCYSPVTPPEHHPLNADKEFSTFLLVGTDLYWDILGDKIVRDDGPTAGESKLAYLLYGPAPWKTAQFLTSVYRA